MDLRDPQGEVRFIRQHTAVEVFWFLVHSCYRTWKVLSIEFENSRCLELSEATDFVFGRIRGRPVYPC